MKFSGLYIFFILRASTKIARLVDWGKWLAHRGLQHDFKHLRRMVAHRRLGNGTFFPLCDPGIYRPTLVAVLHSKGANSRQTKQGPEGGRREG